MKHTRRKVDGAKLREIRQDRYGLSQIGLAKALGLTRDTVSRWENGECQPSPARLLELARLLAADLDEFTTRVPDERPLRRAA
jgi:transcriptional regulator with XRE-family HTH domain